MSINTDADFAILGISYCAVYIEDPMCKLLIIEGEYVTTIHWGGDGSASGPMERFGAWLTLHKAFPAVAKDVYRKIQSTFESPTAAG